MIRRQTAQKKHKNVTWKVWKHSWHKFRTSSNPLCNVITWFCDNQNKSETFFRLKSFTGVFCYVLNKYLIFREIIVEDRISWTHILSIPIVYRGNRLLVLTKSCLSRFKNSSEDFSSCFLIVVCWNKNKDSHMSAMHLNKKNIFW